MSSLEHCPECGALLPDGAPCRAFFDTLLFWENEDMPVRGQVHHLLVLSYHLQHPSLYSPEGLTEARALLTEFVVHGTAPQTVRKQRRTKVASGNRPWAITSRPGHHGVYNLPVRWTMTAADVVAAGADHYVASVTAWAQSIQQSLADQP